MPTIPSVLGRALVLRRHDLTAAGAPDVALGHRPERRSAGMEYGAEQAAEHDDDRELALIQKSPNSKFPRTPGRCP